MSINAVGVVSARAAIADGMGGFSIERIEVDPPAAGEVRVAISAAGVCHTDHASLHWPGPLVLGHEGAGIVEAVGAGVTAVAVGQPVLLNWAIPCGDCYQCARDMPSLCERTHGPHVQDAARSSAHAGGTRWRGEAIARSFHLGTFSEYALVHAEAVTPLPAGLPADPAIVRRRGVGC